MDCVVMVSFHAVDRAADQLTSASTFKRLVAAGNDNVTKFVRNAGVRSPPASSKSAQHRICVHPVLSAQLQHAHDCPRNYSNPTCVRCLHHISTRTPARPMCCNATPPRRVCRRSARLISRAA